MPAIREALLNAVVHRDYANTSDIQIKISDDRITFFSPGLLYGGITIADLKTDHYYSRTRNKLIAEAFYLTNNIEKYGSGFIRIRKELAAYPEIEFDVQEIGGGVLVSFIQHGGVNGSLNGGVNGGVNEVVNDLIIYIRNNPGMRAPELAQSLNISLRTLQRQIKKLRDRGKVEFRGADKTGGYYVAENTEEFPAP